MIYSQRTLLKGKKPGDIPCRIAYGGALGLGFALAGNRHQHSALTRCRLRLTTLGRLRGAALADLVLALASASIRLTTLPVSRGFTAVRTGSRLRFLVQQFDECVFVAVFKFARFDRLHGRGARSKPKFSVAVAAVAVAGVAVATVAAATVAVVAAAVVTVIVTVIGRVAVGAVKGAGA
jgi:hypothetical protein